MSGSAGPIGIFDSGVGGLTVVAEVRRRMPRRDILYFGDTARVPYGNKSPETVLRYSLEIGRFLMGKGISFLVVACNTSSALALEALEKSMPVPVMGMIEPGARAAALATSNLRVGLVGTRATVASGAYTRAIKKARPEVQVFSQACPLFVPLVEEGWTDGPVVVQVVQRYLEPLLKNGVDTLILGCTHYPVLVPVISQVAGPQTTLLSSATTAADALQRLLPETEAGAGGAIGELKLYVTDPGTHFAEIAQRILGEPIGGLVAVEEERLVVP